ALSLPLFVVAAFWHRFWPVPVALFVVGWVFQFAGHYVEGKPPGFFHDWRFLFVGLRWWFAKIRGRAKERCRARSLESILRAGDGVRSGAGAAPRARPGRGARGGRVRRRRVAAAVLRGRPANRDVAPHPATAGARPERRHPGDDRVGAVPPQRGRDVAGRCTA